MSNELNKTTIDQHVAFMIGFLAAKTRIMKTKLPEGYQWSEDNIEKFNFGLECAFDNLNGHDALEEYKTKGMGVIV